MAENAPRTVRSVVLCEFGGFNKIQIIDWPLTPAFCGEDDIEVDVKYCGVNFADLYTRQGLIQNLKLPHVLGLECIGIVAEVGSKVTEFKVGERVLCYNGDGGLYREKVILHKKHCFPVPNHVDDETAVALPANYFTAYFSLFDIGNLKPKQNVLIHSCAGGVGWAATQLARTVENVTIVGTASVDKHEKVKENGVDYVVQSDGYLEELKSDSALKDMKYRVIIDSVGGKNISVSQSLSDSLGKVVVIGVNHIVTSEDKFSILKLLRLWWQTKNISVHDLIMNSSCVAGLHLTNLLNSKPELVQGAMKHIFTLCESGKLKPQIDAIFPLEKVAEGMKKLANRQNIGKVIIKV